MCAHIILHRILQEYGNRFHVIPVTVCPAKPRPFLTLSVTMCDTCRICDTHADSRRLSTEARPASKAPEPLHDLLRSGRCHAHAGESWLLAETVLGFSQLLSTRISQV